MKRYYKDIDGTRIWYKGIITKDNKQIFTWDESHILADGWTLYVPEPVPPYEPSREEKIHADIREKYTDNDELIILRQYTSDPSNAAYKAAFEEYNAYVEEILAKYPKEN